jgi:hypothetical protein
MVNRREAGNADVVAEYQTLNMFLFIVGQPGIKRWEVV